MTGDWRPVVAAAARELKAQISASVERVASGSRLVQDAGSTMAEIVATKNVSVRVLQYKEITSKEPKASTYFKNNVQWSGVPKAAAIDEFLSNHYSICFIFIHRINAHKMFILDQLNADFVKGSYVKGLEKYAKFMLDSDHTILKDTYTAIMKTLEELS